MSSCGWKLNVNLIKIPFFFQTNVRDKSVVVVVAATTAYSEIKQKKKNEKIFPEFCLYQSQIQTSDEITIAILKHSLWSREGQHQ